MKTYTITRHARTTCALPLEDVLNDQQRAAVTCGHGPKLVIAGAGSGKTRTITYRVAYLLAQGVAPAHILLATFTNKAAREMLRRVEHITSQPTGALWGGTFHALGNRFLRKHAQRIGYASNYSILDEEDQRDVLKVCLSELQLKVTEARFPHPSVLREVVSATFNTHLTIPQVLTDRFPHFSQWAEEIERVAQRYQAKKRAANAMDYDDLLRYWHQLLTEHPPLLQQYGRLFQHLLVDEYQDTNHLQAEIVELLASQNRRNLMVVGDDCQSIYQFRGAHYANILEFPQRNPETEIFRLEMNYRSVPGILALANACIAHNTQQHQKTLRAVRPAGERPTTVALNDIYQEAAFIAERMLQLRDEGVPLPEMAVLYRAHAHSTALQAELIRRNIPYDIRSGLRFFEQAHIKDVVAHVKLLVNPRDEAAWRRLLLMIPKVGNVTAGRVWDRLRQSDDPLATALRDQTLASLVPASAHTGWRRFREDLQRLHRLGDATPPAELVQAVLTTAYAEHLRTHYDNAAARLEEIESLAQFATSYTRPDRFLSELVLLGELYGQEVRGAPTTDEERVVLSTVHQAKGLEWQVVFLMRLSEGSFPSPQALRDPWGEEEERRVFYVAITRAKDALYLTYPVMELHSHSTTVLQPSRFLQEVSAELYDEARILEQ